MSDEGQSSRDSIPIHRRLQHRFQHPRASLLGLPDELLEQCISWIVVNPPCAKVLHKLPRHPKNVIYLNERHELWKTRLSNDPVPYTWDDMITYTRDEYLTSADVNKRMLSIFKRCEARNPKLWEIAVDQYYENNTFHASAVRNARSRRDGTTPRPPPLSDEPGERPHIRNLIVNIHISHIEWWTEHQAQFGAPYLEMVKALMGKYPSLRNLTIRLEHASYFAPFDTVMGLHWKMDQQGVQQRKMKLLEGFIMRLFDAMRGLEGSCLKSRPVELNQLADVYTDDYTWPEDFTDIEPTEDEEQLLWRLLDLPLRRAEL